MSQKTHPDLVYFAWRQEGGPNGRKTHEFMAQDAARLVRGAIRVRGHAPFAERFPIHLCVRCACNGRAWWQRIGPDAWPHDAAKCEEVMAERGELLWHEAMATRAASLFPPVGEVPNGAA